MQPILQCLIFLLMRKSSVTAVHQYSSPCMQVTTKQRQSPGAVSCFCHSPCFNDDKSALGAGTTCLFYCAPGNGSGVLASVTKFGKLNAFADRLVASRSGTGKALTAAGDVWGWPMRCAAALGLGVTPARRLAAGALPLPLMGEQSAALSLPLLR